MAVNINKPTVIAVGLYIPGTGFTRVFESVFTYLHRQFDIHWLGIGYKGPTKKLSHYTLYPNNVNGGDVYGGYGAAELAKSLNADSILLLADLYQLKNYREPFLSAKKDGCRILVYAPLDGTIEDPSIAEQFLFTDELILYTDWALQETQNALQKINASDPPHLSFIYHGVDADFFKTIRKDKQKELKKELFDVDHAENTLFILNANRFNERKDIEATLEAYAKALPHLDRDTYLVLHTPRLPDLKKEMLQKRIEELSLKEKILLNPFGNEYTSDEQLRKLYQACEIGVNTSLGEGWGLISFEHACCGAAQLVPDHSAPSEVWKEAAFLLPVSKQVQLPTNPFAMQSVDTDALATALIKLVNDPLCLEHFSTACCLRAHQEQFSWKQVSKKWLSILEHYRKIVNPA